VRTDATTVAKSTVAKLTFQYSLVAAGRVVFIYYLLFFILPQSFISEFFSFFNCVCETYFQFLLIQVYLNTRNLPNGPPLLDA